MHNNNNKTMHNIKKMRKIAIFVKMGPNKTRKTKNVHTQTNNPLPTKMKSKKQNHITYLPIYTKLSYHTLNTKILEHQPLIQPFYLFYE